MALSNLERLKLELSNKNYYKDEEYSVFLEENSLVPSSEYKKETMQIKLLETVINVLETLANDVDLMRKIQTADVATIDQAFEWLNQRITNLKNKIQDLKIQEDETYCNIRPLFFNSRR